MAAAITSAQETKRLKDSFGDKETKSQKDKETSLAPRVDEETSLKTKSEKAEESGTMEDFAEAMESRGEATGSTSAGEVKRFIHIKKADREAIMKAFGVTGRMVNYALYFDGKRGESDTARRIRKMAMERGGILKVTSPAIETLHDSDGYIRQYLPNGVLIEIAKNRSQTADVYKEGELVRHYDGVTIGSIAGIQQWAMAL